MVRCRLHLWLSFFLFFVPVSAYADDDADRLVAKAFDQISVLSQAENGLIIRADIKVLGMQNGDMRAVYVRAWAAEGVKRTELVAPGYQEATITNAGKAWTYQNLRPAPLRVMQIHDALDPLFSPDSMRVAGKVKLSSRKSHGIKVTCIERSGWGAEKRCFDANTGALVQSSEPFWEAQYSDFQPFGTKVFPRAFKVFQNKELVLEGKIMLEKSLTPIASTQFVPGPRFEAVEESIKCETGFPKTVEAGMPVFRVTPKYPQAAKDRRQSGQVIFSAKIGKDGAVKDILVVQSAGLDLDNAAQDAVSKWRYKPYTYCGRAVDVHTFITVNFTIGG
jgi:TonB family protein